ncbi:MAG: ammonium transporter [Armatimonadota bacterium]
MRRFLSILLAASLALPAFAQGAPVAVNPADTVWLIVATALVLLMTPALALFYGGLVKTKNVLNTMLMSFVTMGVGSVAWILIGYSLAFGKSGTGFIGDLQYVLANGVSFTTPYGTQTIPAALFMLFQMKFAIITPALVSGAVAERIKFGSYVIFTALWSLIVYAPLACWVWNPDGWLFKMGALDFAGGTVVHLASGVSALALILILGKRKEAHTEPNNITLTLFGAGLLWFGWFGFNAGSSLAANNVAISAFATTHIAAAMAMCAWMGIEYIRTKRVSAIGCASGLVAGLVAITPAAGYVTIASSLLIGLAAGTVCFFAIELKHRLGYDDALDVVGVHGVGGMLGAMLTGVFADPLVNEAVKASLEKGRMNLIMVQGISVLAVGAFAFILAFAIGKLLAVTIGLRSKEECEDLGLDKAYHGEDGYSVIPADLVARIDPTELLAKVPAEAR